MYSLNPWVRARATRIACTAWVSAALLLGASTGSAMAASPTEDGARPRVERERVTEKETEKKEADKKKDRKKDAGERAEPGERESREAPREQSPAAIEQAAPQVVGDAPLPPQGEPPPAPVIVREPLSIRRQDLSLGLDHRIAPDWVASGLFGISRGRLQRRQTEYPGDMVGQPLAATVSDTRVRTRSLSLAGMLTWSPQPEVFVDASLATQRTKLAVDRLVNELAHLEGQTVGRAWSLALGAGRVWRPGWGQVVPQAGLEYIDARTDPLQTGVRYVDDNTGELTPGFSVGAQRTRTLNLLAGAQWQWPRSSLFGVWAPHLRTQWRERLWLRGDPIVATAEGADPITTDPSSITPRRALTLAGGLSILWPRGGSAFADLGWTRGQGSLRERRLALGLKFEL